MSKPVWNNEGDFYRPVMRPTNCPDKSPTALCAAANLALHLPDRKGGQYPRQAMHRLTRQYSSAMADALRKACSDEQRSLETDAYKIRAGGGVFTNLGTPPL